MYCPSFSKFDLSVRLEGYSEIIHMGASREARGHEWGFGSHIVREKQAYKALILFEAMDNLSLNTKGVRNTLVEIYQQLGKRHTTTH